MKLADLGLKTKPATKYFDGGYVKFNTNNKELSYQIWIYKDKSLLFCTSEGKVKDQNHFKTIMSIKNRVEAVAQ